MCDRAKCPDRRQQLHHDREQYDWNEDFQPPSHAYPKASESP